MEIEVTEKCIIPDGKFCWREIDEGGCDCFLSIEGKYGGPNDMSYYCKYVKNMHPEADSELDGEEEDLDGLLAFVKHSLCPNPYMS